MQKTRVLSLSRPICLSKSKETTSLYLGVELTDMWELFFSLSFGLF